MLHRDCGRLLAGRGPGGGGRFAVGVGNHLRRAGVAVRVALLDRHEEGAAAGRQQRLAARLLQQRERVPAVRAADAAGRRVAGTEPVRRPVGRTFLAHDDRRRRLRIRHRLRYRTPNSG